MTETPPPPVEPPPATVAARPAVQSGREQRSAKLTRFRSRLGGLGVLASVLAVAAAVAAVVGVRQGWLSYSLGKTGLFALVSPALALIGVVLGLLTLALALVKPRRGLKRGAVATLLGLLTVAIVATLAATPHDAPPVHEVATDWRDPLMPSAGLVALRGPQANPIEEAPAAPEGPRGGVLGRLVAEINAKTCPAAAPATVLGTPEAAYARAKAALQAEKLAVVTDDPATGRLEAVAVRGLFAQKDDVIVRVRAEGAGARIDFRSISRDGAVDDGANCARITRLRAAVAR